MNRLELKALLAGLIAAGRRGSEGGDVSRQDRSKFAQYSALDAEAILQAIEDRSTSDDLEPASPSQMDPNRSADGIKADYVCFGGMLLESVRGVAVERTDGGDHGYILRDTVGLQRRALYTAYVQPTGAAVYRAVADNRGNSLADEKLLYGPGDLQRALDAVLADHRRACPELYED